MPATLNYDMKKYAKASPRWQYNNSSNKDIKSATKELLEDECDPDVIPAQFCKLIQKIEKN